MFNHIKGGDEIKRRAKIRQAVGQQSGMDAQAGAFRRMGPGLRVGLQGLHRAEPGEHGEVPARPAADLQDPCRRRQG